MIFINRVDPQRFSSGIDFNDLVITLVCILKKKIAREKFHFNLFRAILVLSHYFQKY